MELANTIKIAREHISTARQKGGTIGFVATMGALHAGHLSLIQASVSKCDYTAVSIFVNPAQFAPNEDLDKYPRTLENDLEMCRNAGVDLVFTPEINEMYPGKLLTWVDVEKLTENLCGRSRPTHFKGVTTVCAKLFNIITPDYAFFGQKDAQQAAVLNQMVKDLNFPLEIIVCPIIRDADGLALSSRNKYLTPDQRKHAVMLYCVLQNAENSIRQGQNSTKTIISDIKQTLNTSALIQVEYVCVVSAENLMPVDRIKGKTLIAVAAKVGSTRLIDNILVDDKAQ